MIQQNLEARKLAEELIQIGEDWCNDFEEVNDQRFWESVRDAVLKKCPLKDKGFDPKTFENATLTFGKHQGKKIKDIPLDYLQWLADQNLLMVRLHKYLRSLGHE